MTHLLQAYLAAAGRLRWKWGTVDCTLFPADWIVSATGRDPAAPYRGRYTTADECHDLIKAEGGFMPLIGWRMDEAGFARTGAPQTGDVGIVSAPISLSERMPVVGAIGAIRVDNVWVTRSLRGLHYEDLPAITAWRIS